MIIGKHQIIYNALTLYNGGTEFRMPSYLVNEVVDKKKILILKHNGENLRSYTGSELLNSIVSVDKKIIEGTFEGQPISFNITVFKI